MCISCCTCSQLLSACRMLKELVKTGTFLCMYILLGRVSYTGAECSGCHAELAHTACRLPPISKRPSGIDGAFLNRGFAFQAPAWARCRLHEIMLRKVFRQASDQKFLRILQDIRCVPSPI